MKIKTIASCTEMVSCEGTVINNYGTIRMCCDQGEVYYQKPLVQEPKPAPIQEPVHVASKPTTNGLLAYYPLNGNANDVTGKHNGTERGSVVYKTQSDGTTAAVFSDSTAIDSNLKLQFKNTDFSMSIWVKKITSDIEYYVGTSIWGTPSRVNDNNGVGWDFMIDKDGRIKIMHVNGNSSSGSAYSQTKIYNDDKFYHVYIYYNHTDNKNIVIVNNGSPETLTVDRSITKDTSFDFFIGSCADKPDLTGKSIIRDVRFYNRALTAEEISTIYNSEKSNF